MKRILLIFIALTTVSGFSYASFPVTEPVSSEVSSLDITNTIEPNAPLPVSGGSPVFGILSLIFSIIAVILFAAAVSAEAPILVVGSLILSILSIVFGGLGFNKSLKGFAITGFVLGCIETLIWIIALIAGTVVAASSVGGYYY